MRVVSTLQAIHSPSHSHCGSTHSRSPSSSPAAGGPDTPSKEKIGVPIFRDDNGQRRMHLVVDLGTTFRPNEITVQVGIVLSRSGEFQCERFAVTILLFGNCSVEEMTDSMNAIKALSCT